MLFMNIFLVMNSLLMTLNGIIMIKFMIRDSVDCHLMFSNLHISVQSKLLVLTFQITMSVVFFNSHGFHLFGEIKSCLFVIIDVILS